MRKEHETMPNWSAFSHEKLQHFKEPTYKILRRVPREEELIELEAKSMVLIAIDASFETGFLYTGPDQKIPIPSHAAEDLTTLLKNIKSEQDFILTDLADILRARKILSWTGRRQLSSLRVGGYRATVEIVKQNYDCFVTIRNEHRSFKKPCHEFKDIHNNHHIGKFHLSIREEYIARAWDIVCEILYKRSIIYFKVVRPGFLLSNICDPTKNRDLSDEVIGQLGKDITIYFTSNPEKSVDDWSEILKCIISSLVRENIPPGYEVLSSGNRADNHIPGACGYASYRFEDPKPENDPLNRLKITLDNEILELYELNNLHSIRERPWKQGPIAYETGIQLK